MTTVFNVLEQPGLTKLEGQLVIVELVASLTDEFAPGFVPSQDLAVFSRAIVKTDVNGRWELDLYPTTEADNVYSVTGLVYKITESAAGGESSYYIDVPAELVVDLDIVPQWVGDLLTVSPTNLPTLGDFTAVDVLLDTTQFDNNLNVTIENVQEFADFFDDFDFPDSGTGGGHVIKQGAETFTQRPTLRIASGGPLVVGDDNVELETTLTFDESELTNVLRPADIGDTVAPLVSGLVPVENLPSLAINDVFTVGSQAAMLALDADVGDVAIRTDTSQSFILAELPATLLGSWVELSFGGAVASVNGATGIVVLDASDIPVEDSGFTGNAVGVTDVQALADSYDALVLPTTAAPTGTAGGQLTGTYPNPSVAASHSGSTHAETQAAAEATSAAALSAHIADTSNAHVGQAISIDSSGFAGFLAGTTTAQTFAATVDQIQGANIPLDTAPFSLNLSPAESNVQALAEFVDQLVFTSPVESVNDLTGAVVLTADDIGAVATSLLGVADGVAQLDSDGRLTLAQWPEGLVTNVNGYNGSEITLVAADIAVDDSAFVGNAVGVIDVQGLADMVDALTTGGAVAASAVSFTPTGTIAATDVQTAIAEVASEAAAGTFDASSFTQNLTTADNTLAEVAARYNAPDRFAVDYAYTRTASPSAIREGTPLFVRIDQDLDYSEPDSGGFKFGPQSQSSLVPDGNWGGWTEDLSPTSTKGFPIGVVTVMGEHVFNDGTHTTLGDGAGLNAAGCTYIDFRTTKNAPGVDANITGVCCYMNNHVYMADDADISWTLGRGTYTVGINNYGSLGFTSQPVFTVNNDTGGTLDGAANTDFYSGPIVMPGVTMANRWGMYVDDAVASYLAFGAIEAGGVIERQVGIQINELVTGDDYNIPINYGDPNVANAPLFRVNDDGQVVTGGVKGLNNILALAPAPSSVGILISDSANTQIGPVSGYTHSSAALKQLELKNTYTMNATTGTLANAWFGLSIDTAVIFDQNNNATGSAGYSLTSTFSNKTTENRNLTSIYGAFLAPTITSDATGTATNITGVYSAPFLATSGTGTLAVSNIIGFQSSPNIGEDVTVTNRYGLTIDAATLTSNGAVTNQYGISIAAMTNATTLNIGILNASSTILTGGLWGSQASGGDLDIRSTTHATTGTIFLHDEVEQRPTDQTFTATPNWLFWNNAYTMNMATASIGSFVSIAPTVLMQQSGSGFGSIQAIDVFPTVKTLTTGTADLGLVVGVQVRPTITADTITGRSASAVSYYARPAFTQANSGTITSGTTKNFSSGLTIGTGNTQSAFTHIALDDATGSGTITTQIGIDIAALAKGGTNYGIRSLAAINILAALYGSTSSGGHLPLRSTTDTTKGDIQLDNPTIELFVTNYTNTAAAYNAAVVDHTVTMNGTAGAGLNVYTGLKWAPTIAFDQAGTAFGSVFTIADQATYTNVTTEANNLGLVTSFTASPTLSADTATITGNYVGFNTSPTLNRVGASGGFTTNTTAIGFKVGLTVAANTTVTTGTGLSIGNPSNAGTLTTYVGVDIAQPTTATTNIGIRNKGTTELGTSSQTVFGTAGTLTTFAGMADGVNIATGASTGTIIANSATAQKLGFFAKTPVVQPTSANQAAVGTTAPAGGTGATAGAYDNATNRNTMITTVNSCVTLVNQLRSDLVSLGLIKGS